MNLDYALLISPTPLQLNLCSVRSPTLREIDALPDKFNTYHMYLSMLLLDIDTYYKNMELQGDSYFAGYTEKEKQQILSIRAEYAGLTEEQRALTGRLDIFGFDRKIVVPLTQALSFFLCEKIIYSPEENEFLIFGAESADPVCTINSRQLSELESIILQLNAVSVNTMDAADAKNKTAAKIIEKLNKRKKRETGSQAGASQYYFSHFGLPQLHQHTEHMGSYRLPGLRPVRPDAAEHHFRRSQNVRCRMGKQGQQG